MGLGKKTIDDQNYCGKKVLVRCDFNVPMKDGVITNENRINAALPTIQKLVNDGAKVILCSHLGKPKNGPEAKFSLAPVAVALSAKLGKRPRICPSSLRIWLLWQTHTLTMPSAAATAHTAPPQASPTISRTPLSAT